MGWPSAPECEQNGTNWPCHKLSSCLTFRLRRSGLHMLLMPLQLLQKVQPDERMGIRHELHTWQLGATCRLAESRFGRPVGPGELYQMNSKQLLVHILDTISNCHGRMSSHFPWFWNCEQRRKYSIFGISKQVQCAICVTVMEVSG